MGELIFLVWAVTRLGCGVKCAIHIKYMTIDVPIY